LGNVFVARKDAVSVGCGKSHVQPLWRTAAHQCGDPANSDCNCTSKACFDLCILTRDSCRRAREALALWGGEFGRTPTAQGSDGRNHNPEAFTMWIAGGGVKSGLQYGPTDDYGYYSVVNNVHFHDLHATILHLLGIDHTRLTYRYAGRDFRLTDVHGNVVRDIIA
jgi:hypothetical protein